MLMVSNTMKQEDAGKCAVESVDFIAMSYVHQRRRNVYKRVIEKRQLSKFSKVTAKQQQQQRFRMTSVAAFGEQLTKHQVLMMMIHERLGQFQLRTR